MEYFNNRKLKEFEIEMRKQHKCIACGTKVKVIQYRKRVDGKLIVYRTIWPFECPDCKRTRCQLSSPTDGYDFGPCRASMHHEYVRRIGGKFGDGA